MGTPATPPRGEKPRPHSLAELFWAFTWLALQGFGGVLAVVQEAGLMHDISPDSRATVLSSYSLITKLLSAVQIFLVGFLAINNNITTPTFWFVVVSLSFFALLRIRDKFIAQKQSSVRV